MMIGNNTTVNLAYNSYNATTKALERTTRALTTGLRAASAADDASGYAIGEKISSQVAGVDRAIRNSQDGISMLQTAEGALNEINSMLQRMRELTVEAANDSLTTQDRNYIQLEIGELRKNINNVAGNTTFNGKRLLDGSSTAIWSADNENTKVKVTGAITAFDSFGQKKATNGNYRIEIRSKPGKGEIKKTSFFPQTIAEEYTDTETTPYLTVKPVDPIKDIPNKPTNEINIESGVDSTSAASGNGWNFSNGVLTITGSGTYNIVGSNTATTNRIVISEGVKASVFLTDVNIDVSSTRYASAFDMSGAKVDLYLSGTNTLTSGYDVAGILTQNIGSKTSELTINSASGFASEDGILNATCDSGCGAGIGGACHTAESGPSKWQGSTGKITINGGTINATANGPGAGIGGGAYFTSYSGVGSEVNVIINGGNITATGTGGAGIGSGAGSRADYTNVDSIIIAGGTITATGGAGSAAIGGGVGGNSGKILIDYDVRENMTLSGWIDTENGNTEPIGRGQNGLYQDPYEVAVTKTRIREATLADMPEFTNAESVFLVNEPQKIKITQGDGKTAEVLLYSNDTLKDVASKINDAIANDLGQGAYTDNIKNFCTIADGTPGIEAAYDTEKVYGKIYIRDDDGNLILDEYNQPQEFLPEDYAEYLETHTEEELEAFLETGLIGETTTATMLIRSAVAGSAGKLTFSSDNNDLINALGLMTIQDAEDNVFKASIYDAHSNLLIASNIESDGNTLNGVIHPNISVEFDAMANTKAIWSENGKNYVFQTDGQAYNTTIHILDRSTSFQIGQNTGEDIFINIGDMRTSALGIDGVDVSTRQNASDSIAMIDAALHKVNSQRSKIGSYQNELEYNTNSLRQTSIHLQESESRIKDADMSKEAIEFVKLQILNNTGSSMLAQANQNSQSIMSLFNL